MKAKDFKDLKAKDLKELTKLLTEKRLESLKIKAKIASGKEKNIKAFRNLRRDIARIATLVGELTIAKKFEKPESVKGAKGKEEILK